jgi:hypothetical protein
MLMELFLVTIDSRRDCGGEIRPGDRACMYESRSESGGEVLALAPPRRTWHVGQSLTNLEISSLGTLRLLANCFLNIPADLLNTMSTLCEPEPTSCLFHHVDIVCAP